jgi:hypothetical protein
MFHCRRLMMEELECRAMMTGNVTVTVTDGILSVQGDGWSNDVQIRQLKQTYTGEWPGAKLEISGTYMGRSNTLINGQSGPVVVEGVKSGAVIDLGDGKNALRIANIPQDSTVPTKRQVSMPGEIKITTGSGKDDIRLYLNNGKNVTVSAGGGPDYLQLTGAQLNQLTINSDPRPAVNPNPDDVSDEVQISRLMAKGDVVINGGDTYDRVVINRSQFGGKFTADLGLGWHDHLSIWGEDGAPTVFGGPISVVGEQAAVGIFFAVINQGFVANVSGSIVITTGLSASGNDELTVTVSGTEGGAPPDLQIQLGAGDDSLVLAGSDVWELEVDGGDGFDTLTTVGENSFVSTRIRNVEETIDG